MTKIYYHETHYFSVGKPTWTWELNKTAKLFVFAGTIVILYSLVFTFLLPLLFFTFTGNGMNPAFMDELTDKRNGLICIMIACCASMWLLGETPSVGSFQYKYFKADLRIDELGIKFLISKDCNSTSYDWSWSCLWKHIDKIKIQQEMNQNGSVIDVMTITGNASASEIRPEGANRIIKHRKQRKIFGGSNKIIVRLGNYTSDILPALEFVKEANKSLNISISHSIKPSTH